MDMKEDRGPLPLAQVEDQGELIRQYGAFDSRTLRRWSQVIIGPHREAMVAVLRQRGEPVS